MVVTPFWGNCLATIPDKSRVQTWSAFLALAVFISLIFLIRKKKLKASYSLLWFIALGAGLVFIISPNFMDQLGQLLGIHYSPTLLVLLMVFFLGLILLHITIVITRLSQQINRLSQELARLKESSTPCED